MKAMKAAKLKAPQDHVPLATLRRRVRKELQRAVYHGTREKTYTGKTKEDLMKTKTGRIVSKAAHAAGSLNEWARACGFARKVLGLKGFQVVKKGSPLYTLANDIYHIGM